MTEFDSVFFDTSPFIYLIENNPKFYQTVSKFKVEQRASEVFLVTSVLTRSEFGVNPKKTKNLKPIEDFRRVLEEFDFRVVEITDEIADLSSTLRAKYSFLKSIDSLQLASALSVSCRKFLTNDFKLKKIEELEILIIEELPSAL
jgi:predicted nucleic acid-binding protein